MRSILRLLLSKNPLRQMADTDRNVLAVCIGAAFVFWLILNLSRDYSITRPVAVDYLVDPERVLVGRMPEELYASLTGSGWNLIWESLRPNPVSVEVDVRNRENLRLSVVDLERQVSRNLSSNKLSVTLPGVESLPILTTPKEGKRVPVVNRIRVSFADGHLALDTPVIQPDSITISGASDVLEDISEWPTKTMEIENVSRNVTRAVPLEEASEGVTLSYKEVSFNMPVEAFIQQRFILPIELENARPGVTYEFTPRTATLVANIPQSRYGSIDAEDFTLVADVGSQISEESGSQVLLSVQRVPEGVQFIRVEPRVVTYFLRD